MGDFLKQLGFLLLDYLMGFLASLAIDMRHSINYRVKEQAKKRNGSHLFEKEAVLDFNEKKYKILCDCKDILILREIEGYTKVPYKVDPPIQKEETEEEQSDK